MAGSAPRTTSGYSNKVSSSDLMFACHMTITCTLCGRHGDMLYLIVESGGKGLKVEGHLDEDEVDIKLTRKDGKVLRQRDAQL